MDAYINVADDREFPPSDKWVVQFHGSCLLIGWCYLAPIAAALVVLLKVHGVKDALNGSESDGDGAVITVPDTFLRGRLAKVLPGKSAATRASMMLAHKCINTLVLILHVVGCAALWWVRTSREADTDPETGNSKRPMRWGNGHAATHPHANIFGRLITLLMFLQPVWFVLFNRPGLRLAGQPSADGKSDAEPNKALVSMHAVLGWTVMGLAYWNAFWGAANWQVGWGSANDLPTHMKYGFYVNYFCSLVFGISIISFANLKRKSVRGELAKGPGSADNVNDNKMSGAAVGKSTSQQ